MSEWTKENSGFNFDECYTDYNEDGPMFVARQQRAITESMFAIQNTRGYGIKSESGNLYDVSLNYCSCPDFEANGSITPCKHMFFLADYLGIFDNRTGFFRNSTNSRLIKFVENNVLKGHDIRGIAQGITKITSQIKELENKRLVEISIPNDVETLGFLFTKREIFTNFSKDIEQQGVKIFESWTKQKMIDVVSQYPDVYKYKIDDYVKIAYIGEADEFLNNNENRIRIIHYVYRYKFDNNLFNVNNDFLENYCSPKGYCYNEPKSQEVCQNRIIQNGPENLSYKTYKKPSTVGIGKRCKNCNAVIDYDVVMCPSCNKHFTQTSTNNDYFKITLIVFAVIIILAILRAVL